jgi:sugar-specific transcriptional regulator TrmB
MEIPNSLTSLGLSQYVVKAYMTLVGTPQPVNGSQLSNRSGIPRARIYDVLRQLRSKGMAVELEEGLYAPLPPEEMVKRLRHRFETDMAVFEQMLAAAAQPPRYDYVWTIEGYEEVMAKAAEMIDGSESEVYIRVLQQEGVLLEPPLRRAEARGVAVKYISLGTAPCMFDFQVIHQGHDRIIASFGGRSIDIVVDKEQILVGVFKQGQEDLSPVNWTKNRAFVASGRESLRHDFFHIFLHKTYDLGQALTEREKTIYEVVKNDY